MLAPGKNLENILEITGIFKIEEKRAEGIPRGPGCLYMLIESCLSHVLASRAVTTSLHPDDT